MIDFRGWPVRTLLRLLSVTWRIHEEEENEARRIIDGDAPCVIVFWHGGMFPVWYRFARHRVKKPFGALISASRDGSILADWLERNLGYSSIIRGSSSRGGGEALRGVVAGLRKQSYLLTPDGPRGPCGVAKPGAILAARRAGVPIVAVGWSTPHLIHLKSWDRAAIPHPFSTLNFRYCMVRLGSDIKEADGLEDEFDELKYRSADRLGDGSDGSADIVDRYTDECDGSDGSADIVGRYIDEVDCRELSQAIDSVSTEGCSSPACSGSAV